MHSMGSAHTLIGISSCTHWDYHIHSMRLAHTLMGVSLYTHWDCVTPKSIGISSYIHWDCSSRSYSHWDEDSSTRYQRVEVCARHPTCCEYLVYKSHCAQPLEPLRYSQAPHAAAFVVDVVKSRPACIRHIARTL